MFVDLAKRLREPAASVVQAKAKGDRRTAEHFRCLPRGQLFPGGQLESLLIKIRQAGQGFENRRTFVS
jgi:hypothetical protein